MKSIVKGFVLSIALFFAVAFAGVNAQAQVREIPAPINDIAIASFDMYGPVIYYNPIIVSQAGPLLWEFFRAHEYGHINLRTGSEMAADCYATQALLRTNPAAIEAFIQFKASQGMAGGDATHLPGIERARFVDACRRGMHNH